jgi:uncharacterized protein (DUF1330 family)
MAGYIIANIDVKDAVAYEEYRAKVGGLIRKHGGEALVRGAESVVAEGNWKPKRLVVLRFPDMAAARAFYDDPEYQPLKELRLRVTQSDLVFTEGT